MYQTKLLKFGVQTVLSSNRIKFEQYDGLLDEAYSCCNAYMLDNQDPFDQIENYKTVEVVYSVSKMIRIQGQREILEL